MCMAWSRLLQIDCLCEALPAISQIGIVMMRNRRTPSQY